METKAYIPPPEVKKEAQSFGIMNKAFELLRFGGGKSIQARCSPSTEPTPVIEHKKPRGVASRLLAQHLSQSKHQPKSCKSFPKSDGSPACTDAADSETNFRCLISHFRKFSSPRQQDFLDSVLATTSKSAKERQTLASDTYRKLHQFFGPCEDILKFKAHSDRQEAEIFKLRQQVDGTERDLLDAQKAKECADNEANKLIEQLANLNRIHVRSVNGVGAGLDPISDQVFRERFATYHQKTSQWCRKNFRRKSVTASPQFPPFLLSKLSNRWDRSELGNLSCSQVVDLFLWAFVDNIAMEPLFPVFMNINHGCNTAMVMESFSYIDSPEQQKRVAFWRSYTACLAIQSPDFPMAVDFWVNETMNGFLTWVMGLFNSPHDVDRASLEAVIRPLYVTIAEMRCQRGHYELEPLTGPVLFDEETMEDIDSEDRGESENGGCSIQVVRVVMSSGIVKRPYAGSDEVIGRIGKMRVLVKDVDEVL